MCMVFLDLSRDMMAAAPGGLSGNVGGGVPVQLEANSVQTVAESVGLGNALSEKLATRLAEDVDFRLRLVVQEAVSISY